jgi:hypothetical protein
MSVSLPLLHPADINAAKPKTILWKIRFTGRHFLITDVRPVGLFCSLFGREVR